MNIIRKIIVSMAVPAAVFSITGCVSTGTFDKMVSGKDEEIKTLQRQKTDLEQKKFSLEQQITELGQQNSILEQDYTSLKQQNETSEQKNMYMQQQVGSLEQQKAALLAASQQRQQQYDALLQNLSKEVEQGQIKVRQYQNMLSVDLAEQIFFDSGRSTLNKGGKDVLKKVGEALKEYESKVIRVVGHTDNVKIAKTLRDKFPTNWELSVARATTVVRFLQDVGIPPQRMVASGRGEYDPVASNDTEEDRLKNRRIEIMLIDQSLVNEMEKLSK